MRWTCLFMIEAVYCVCLEELDQLEQIPKLLFTPRSQSDVLLASLHYPAGQLIMEGGA